ncbi:MAG: VanZ family protein, partial [Oscillospiraceae bacterium]|nr:VanZ family protein [Oscillospiraceae bacterium]
KMGITFTAAAQIGGNILIALPYGVYLGIRIKRRKVLLYCLLPLLFPIIIESLQFIISSIVGVVYRSFDIDDFILNLCGGYLGIVFLRLFSKIKLGIQRSNNRS